LKTFVVILLLAAAGYWGYRHGYIKLDWFGGSGGTASAPGNAPAESLEQALNRGLPRMVSNDISADRAVASNLLVTFNYRFVDLDQYAVAQRYGSTLPADIRSALIQELCARRAVREEVLGRGREVQLQIHAQDGRTMFTTQLRPGGC
jgi:hypothetical protein